MCHMLLVLLVPMYALLNLVSVSTLVNITMGLLCISCPSAKNLTQWANDNVCMISSSNTFPGNSHALYKCYAFHMLCTLFNVYVSSWTVCMWGGVYDPLFWVLPPLVSLFFSLVVLTCTCDCSCTSDSCTLEKSSDPSVVYHTHISTPHSQILCTCTCDCSCTM